MEEQAYTKREVDLIIDKMTIYHESTQKRLIGIEDQVKYTNGKVKRITIVIVVIISFIVFFGFKTAFPLIFTLI